MDQLPRLGKRELVCLLLFTCNYVVSVRRGFLFFWVHGMDYVIYCGTPWTFHIMILDFFHYLERVPDIAKYNKGISISKRDNVCGLSISNSGEVHGRHTKT